MKPDSDRARSDVLRARSRRHPALPRCAPRWARGRRSPAAGCAVRGLGRRIVPVDRDAVPATSRELGGREVVEQRVVIRRQSREGADAIDGAGPDRLHEREQLGAHAVTKVEPGLRSTDQAVRDPAASSSARGVARRSARQRPYDPSAAMRNPARTPQPAATQQVEEDGLRSVVCGVGRRDEGPSGATSSRKR